MRIVRICLFIFALMAFRDSFLPYTDTCGEEVYKMLNYPSEDVRQAAVGAMAQFVNSLAKSSAPEAAEGKMQHVS